MSSICSISWKLPPVWWGFISSPTMFCLKAQAHWEKKLKLWSWESKVRILFMNLLSPSLFLFSTRGLLQLEDGGNTNPRAKTLCQLYYLFELNLRASVLKHFCSLGHFHLALKDGEKVEKEKMYRMTDNKKIPTRVQLQVSKGNFGGTEGVN